MTPRGIIITNNHIFSNPNDSKDSFIAIRIAKDNAANNPIAGIIK